MSFLWSAWESGMRRRKERWRNMKRCAALFLTVLLLCGVLKGCAPRPEKGQALVEEKGVKVTYTGMEQAEDGDVALHLRWRTTAVSPLWSTSRSSPPTGARWPPFSPARWLPGKRPTLF